MQRKKSNVYSQSHTILDKIFKNKPFNAGKDIERDRSIFYKQTETIDSLILD